MISDCFFSVLNCCLGVQHTGEWRQVVDRKSLVCSWCVPGQVRLVATIIFRLFVSSVCRSSLMLPCWAPASVGWWLEEGRRRLVMEEAWEDLWGSEGRMAAWWRTISQKLDLKVFPAWAKLPAWVCPPQACDWNGALWLDVTLLSTCL